jgi:hypothetical protein
MDARRIREVTGEGRNILVKIACDSLTQDERTHLQGNDEDGVAIAL